MLKTLLTCVLLVIENDAAKILAYYPTPSISHQVVFRPLSLELAKRGHEIVVITTDPMFKDGNGPSNLQEIDVHDISYAIWQKMVLELKNTFSPGDYEMLMKLMASLVEEQINTNDVQKLLKDKSKYFDLVIVEAVVESALGLGFYYKAPVIQFSSFAVAKPTLSFFGTSVHPFIFPTPFHERVYNLTVWEKLQEIYNEYNFEQIVPNNLEYFDDVQKRLFGPDVPSIQEMRANVDMLFVNVNSLWDFNRPVPPNVIYLGGLHAKAPKDLPKDLQSYLDSSKNGVIFVSFGTNVDPGLFPSETVQTLVNVFSKLPYDVLWKWNQDELRGRTRNIKISKWLPQSDLLRHPKVKLFITQGGLQSTDEAITAGVPLIGIPVFGDQKFNVEQYLYFKIGEKVELETMTEDTLSNAIVKVLNDDSYRENIVKLGLIVHDQPQKPLERAVWWTEYVIRHKGAKHLRSPAANISITEYLELKLVSYIALGLLLVISIFVCLVTFAYKAVFRNEKKIKKN